LTNKDILFNPPLRAGLFKSFHAKVLPTPQPLA